MTPPPTPAHGRYAEGMPKTMYWDHTYEDVMNLLARLPEVAALIYRCSFYDGVVPAYDKSLDYSGNFCKMLGFDDKGFHELMRLYVVIRSPTSRAPPSPVPQP